MSKILEILEMDIKHKEKVVLITEKILISEITIDDLVELLQDGNKVEKGTSAEVMKFVSKEKPELLISKIDILLEYVNFPVNRVKWGIPETIGNLAQKYPKEVEKTIPKLLINTEEKSTVIRWCAAYALSEIAKHNIDKREELVALFQKLIAQEQNNGVKNVYLKAIKHIEIEK